MTLDQFKKWNRGLFAETSRAVPLQALRTRDQFQGFVLFRCPGGGRGCVRVRRNNWRSGWCTVSPGVIHVWPLDKQINNDNRLSTPLDAEARVTVSSQSRRQMSPADACVFRTARPKGTEWSGRCSLASSSFSSPISIRYSARASSPVSQKR